MRPCACLRGAGLQCAEEVYSMTNRELARLHPADVPLWFAVESACWRLARAAKCNLRKVSPLPRHLIGQFQGWFIHAPYSEIQISLRTSLNGNKWGERYYHHQLFDLICHEMAHCAIGCNRGDVHGSKFFRRFAKMIELAENIGLHYELRSSRVSLRD